VLTIALALLIGAGLLAAYYRYVRAVHGNRGCAHNLQMIGQAIWLYADAHGGQLPDSFQTLARNAELKAIGFVCPLDDAAQDVDPTAPADADRLTQAGHLSYIYAGRGLTATALTGKVALAFEPLSDHGNGMNVLLGDGSVEFLNVERAKAVAARAAAGGVPVALPP
jgi:prepilin-type processing-associated H-X9-DG protein